MADLSDVWEGPPRKWPTIVYVETTNRCNANCRACLNDKVLRKRVTMDQATFEFVADKVKAHGLRIGAMFCFGEPLLDPGICSKYRYAAKIDVLMEHVGLNTNCSMLTEDRHDEILFSLPNIILSFFNVGKAFEELTQLNWERCYGNALAFIAERDVVKPSFPIFIGVNKVRGHDLDAVKQAFAGFNVRFVQDAELNYDDGGIVGVLNRTRMYPDWRCDGYKGALQIKPDGGAEFCAYDIIGTPTGGETRIGNFLDDSWNQLEAAFRAAWKAGPTLCQRCDYWYGAKELLEGMKK